MSSISLLSVVSGFLFLAAVFSNVKGVTHNATGPAVFPIFRFDCFEGYYEHIFSIDKFGKLKAPRFTALIENFDENMWRKCQELKLIYRWPFINPHNSAIFCVTEDLTTKLQFNAFDEFNFASRKDTPLDEIVRLHFHKNERKLAASLDKCSTEYLAGLAAFPLVNQSRKYDQLNEKYKQATSDILLIFKSVKCRVCLSNGFIGEEREQKQLWASLAYEAVGLLLLQIIMYVIF